MRHADRLNEQENFRYAKMPTCTRNTLHKKRHENKDVHCPLGTQTKMSTKYTNNTLSVKQRFPLGTQTADYYVNKDVH